MSEERAGFERARLGFNELLLGGIILVMLTAVGLGLALYVLPSEELTIPELQPAVRVADESAFPIGASRVTNWGDHVILVIHRSEGDYVGLQGTSPLDECILTWDEESLRVLSPCSYLVYDLHGNVVAGLTTEPLQRYPVFVREGVVFVAVG